MLENHKPNILEFLEDISFHNIKLFYTVYSWSLNVQSWWVMQHFSKQK